MNIIAGIFINVDERELHNDYEKWLKKPAPEKPYSQYKHNGYENNADAHLKRTIMGRETVVAITNGDLDFGTWEQVFYFEFADKREKRVLIKIIGKRKIMSLSIIDFLPIAPNSDCSCLPPDTLGSVPL